MRKVKAWIRLASAATIVVLATARLLHTEAAVREVAPSDRLHLMENDVPGPPLRPEEFEASMRLDSTERTTIAGAMEELQRNTCLRFVPRAREDNYIHILKAFGCSSSVGCRGGPQRLTLGPSCLYVGVIIHELMHVAGFWHEHSRNDRDKYITINKANIQSGMWFNFEKYSWDEAKSLGVAYDLDSVMHYGPYAFAKDRSVPTIIPRVTGTNMGQRRGLSQKDILKLQDLYECNSRKDLSPDLTTASTLTTAASVGPCRDHSEHCQTWTAAGECDTNQAWMHISCRKACGVCSSAASCQDNHEDCRGWARIGECTNNPKYMLSFCGESCGRC
ncbi:Zinc metalloproteinase nas-13 [Chionoecetes opilio]|uniref:Metalloendopeptidase n=1 Tax=Chionoecetes opilio TaxID=41210 RepID=A0A8J4YZ04_CHIOP|nr:Zinc metalloproteinase nas-13 [Chionoecetes opilio]